MDFSDLVLFFLNQDKVTNYDYNLEPYHPWQHLIVPSWQENSIFPIVSDLSIKVLRGFQKKVAHGELLEPKNLNQHWVLCGQIFP